MYAFTGFFIPKFQSIADVLLCLATSLDTLLFFMPYLKYEVEPIRIFQIFDLKYGGL